MINLVARLRSCVGTSLVPSMLTEAAEALEAQAERIAELEEKLAGRTDYALSLRRRLDTARMESHTLRVQLADAELHTKQVERGLDKATAQLAEIEKTEPVDVVLTFNYGQLVKVHIADHTLYEVDLSPKPYFQVCWAHGWAGIYSSEDEAAEDCLSLCGHGRSIREIKPGDDGYRNPNAINLIEQRFPVSQLFTHPMPAQRLTELKLLMLTTAYEQGVGKGIQRRDCNPYAADTDEHATWKLGYEEGLGLRRI